MTRFGLIAVLILIALALFLGCGPLFDYYQVHYAGRTLLPAPTAAPAAGPHPETASGPAAGPSRAPTAAPAAPVATAAPAVDANNANIKSKSLDSKDYVLEPGHSVNGGRINVNGTLYGGKDGQIVVLTNNSTKRVQFSCPAGCGWEDTTDQDFAVKGELKRGCSSTGCDSVLHVNISNSGVSTETLTK